MTNWHPHDYRTFPSLGHSNGNTLYEMIFPVLVMVEQLFELFLLVIALSVDAFAVSFAYGVSHIHIPPLSIGILTGISSATLFFSLFAGHFLSALLPTRIMHAFSFCVLFFLGISKVLDNSSNQQANRANKDKNNILSPKESLWLGTALSIDSIAVMSPIYILIAVGVSFLMGITAILSGLELGKSLSRRFRKNPGWTSGILLILLSFLTLF
ncbi:MAG: manganese efflux pump [Lachnospiraceae bacterium]